LGGVQSGANARRRLDAPDGPSYIGDERSLRVRSIVTKKTSTTTCCPPAEPMPPVPADEGEANAQLARLAKAIAHPARVAMLRLLVRQEGCIVGDLVDELPLAQSTVSQHLKQLKEAGLIRGDVDGPRVCYCVEPGAVALLKALVEGL
jgi:ArsR family transcriptional regulator